MYLEAQRVQRNPRSEAAWSQRCYAAHTAVLAIARWSGRAL